MSLTVSYKGNDIINEASACIKVMNTAGKYLEDDITIDFSETSGGDPYEKINEICSNTCLHFKSEAEYTLPWSTGNTTPALTNLVFFSMRNLTKSNNNKYLQNGTFRNMSSLKYANIGNYVSSVSQNCFNGTSALKALIIGKKSSPFSVSNSNNFSNSGIANGNGYVYVPDLDENGNDLVAQYKAASIWSNYASRIKGFSEAPDYSANTAYEIGDVCKYNSKFYGYCKSDLSSSTGNAPTGTTEDNEFWEYVADIGSV